MSCISGMVAPRVASRFADWTLTKVLMASRNRSALSMAGSAAQAEQPTVIPRHRTPRSPDYTRKRPDEPGVFMRQSSSRLYCPVFDFNCQEQRLFRTNKAENSALAFTRASPRPRPTFVTAKVENKSERCSWFAQALRNIVENSPVTGTETAGGPTHHAYFARRGFPRVSAYDPNLKLGVSQEQTLIRR